MNKLFMMVGLQGSGKTYQANILAEKYNAKIFSSDEYRELLLDSVDNQTDNSKVFETLYEDIFTALLNGHNVIFDATNLNSKKRRLFLDTFKEIECEKICVLVLRTFYNCTVANALRERHVPEDSIMMYYKSFQVPYKEEGWDDIWLIYSDNDEGVYGSPTHFSSLYRYYDQSNHHHSHTLGDHMMLTRNYVTENFMENEPHAKELWAAASLHDIGKPFCRTFINKKGIKVEEAHYYGHDCVGAYDSLFVSYEEGVDKLLVAFLVGNHMRPIVWRDSEKARNRDEKNWGTEKFELVKKLGEADNHAL